MRDVRIAHTPVLVEPIAELLPREQLRARHAASPWHARHRQECARLAVARSIDAERLRTRGIGWVTVAAECHAVGEIDFRLRQRQPRSLQIQADRCDVGRAFGALHVDYAPRRDRIHRRRVVFLRCLFQERVTFFGIARELRELGRAGGASEIGRITQTIFDRAVIEARFTAGLCGLWNECCFSSDDARGTRGSLRRKIRAQPCDLILWIRRTR